jgi:PAS domain S-box-containing protein
MTRDPSDRSEQLLSDAMFESMPGVLYFYDANGRFLRWNHNFETVTGYSRDEIARMHPLDFFSAEDKPRVEQRIAEVFATGESSIEIPFVAAAETGYALVGRIEQGVGAPDSVEVSVGQLNVS